MASVLSGPISGLDREAGKVEGNGSEARVSGDGDVISTSSGEKARVSEVALDSRTSESGADGRVLGEGGGSKEKVKDEVGVSNESDVGNNLGGKSEGYDEENVKTASFVQFDTESDQFDPQDDDSDGKDDQISHTTKREVYNSLLSEFDDFVANERNDALVGTSRALSYGFEVGDMVWGKVKSHPWWPGHIYNEAFASSSVRRTRREGHVLVAFFGDSSYGWFDPAELIPFDLHFTEKSQQINSRNFIKAVEEAVDEASRRCGLGLACKCRNRYNFRPTNVQGYFTVDVPDYEAGGVYSVSQIEKSRNRFRPVETIAFMKDLASGPLDYDCCTIDCIMNKATIFAYRKAVFEEFDETYAQAFGVQPTKTKDKPNVSDHPIKEPTRAPLSGPLVIAETLGGGKSSKKPLKVKDHSKKDKYLLKRRDELVESKAVQVGLRQPNSSNPAAYVEGSSTVGDGDYILQKRVPAPHTLAKEESAADDDLSGKGAVLLDQSLGHSGALPSPGAVFDAKKSLDEKDAQEASVDKKGYKVVVGLASISSSNLSGKGSLVAVDSTSSPQQDVDAKVDRKDEEMLKLSRSNEGSQQTEFSISVRQEGDDGLGKSPVVLSNSQLSSLDAKHSGAMKKTKALKRPLGDPNSENSNVGERKKKKKKALGTESIADRPKKHLAPGKVGVAVGDSPGKANQVALVNREDIRVNNQKRDVDPSNSSLNGIGNSEPELPQCLYDLHALALNPFHGSERNRGPPSAVQFFLQFRSLNYQKSLALSVQSETEPVDVRITRSPSVAVVDSSGGDNVRDSTISKPSKPAVRPDDPTKAGRKRLPSDRQDEIAAKRLKKINQLKSLAAEKKMGQRTSEASRTEGKELVATAPSRQVAVAPPRQFIKPGSVKKMEPPAKESEPTMLVMKFPPSTSLPSVAELKARFARFGSLDQSAIRVFWKSSTCRVVFRRKLDAEAAYKYAIGNSSLFGNDVGVRYLLREAGAPEASESDKGREEIPIEAPRVKDPVFERPVPAPTHQPLPQSTVQLKSILKKPAGDEAGQATGGGNGGRGTTRVKFNLSGEETSRGDQTNSMVGNRNNYSNNASFGDGGGGAPTASSSVAMDINSKNFQKVIPPSPSPVQLSKPPVNKSHYHTEVVPPRNLQSVNIPSAPPTIDISQQMLSLLTRCNDVVTGVRGLLGYVPYHPL